MKSVKHGSMGRCRVYRKTPLSVTDDDEQVSSLQYPLEEALIYLRRQQEAMRMNAAERIDIVSPKLICWAKMTVLMASVTNTVMVMFTPWQEPVAIIIGVSMNFAGLLFVHLRGSGCHVFQSDMKVGIQTAGEQHFIIRTCRSAVWKRTTNIIMPRLA
ncbi:MAG: hypothetical protein R3E95_04850 [Thiolinea sp.]